MKKTATTTTANLLKKALDKSQELSNRDSDIEKFYDGAAQSVIPVKDVKNGIIITTDNRYIGVIEVLPINYEKMERKDKIKIINKFKDFFKADFYKFGFKIVSDSSDTSELIRNIRKQNKNIKDEKVKNCLLDYINFVKTLGSRGAVVKRYYFIYEYNGLDGEKANKFEDIAIHMQKKRNDVIAAFSNCGNPCVTYDSIEEQTYATLDFIYRFFNKKSYKSEGLEERQSRLKDDFYDFNYTYNADKKVTIPDLVAPKGIYFINRNYVYMDGRYYTYIGITGDGFPEQVNAAWLECFMYGQYVDIDINCIKYPTDSTKTLLKGYNSITKSSVNEAIERRQRRAERLLRKYQNNTTVFNRMSSGEDLYRMSIVLTISADTLEETAEVARMLRKHIKEQLALGYDDAFLCSEEYFQLTMPFLVFPPKLFSRLKHDMLSSDLASLYPFVAYQLNDPKGFVMGINDENYSLISLNPFDTSKYFNANISILGTSGAGKTFTEELIGRRMFFNGARCFYIIPKKGYNDYYAGCQAIGGLFISFMPGSTDCINPLEIRPEGKADLSRIDENTKQEKGSWLSHKITSLCCWINLLLKNRSLSLAENNALTECLMEVYKTKGITSDNTSIYKDLSTGEIKEMPILGELLEETEKRPVLEDISGVIRRFVTGPASNMNGQTNVDLASNRYIVFDVDEDLISEELFSGFLYLAFDCVYAMVKSNIFSRDFVFLDELWKMMIVEAAATQVHNMVKLIRAYGGSTVVATQEMGDYKKSAGEKGISVLNNSELNLYLYMKPEDLQVAAELMNLTEKDKEDIESLVKGKGLLKSHNNTLKIQILPSELELNTLTTDINNRSA